MGICHRQGNGRPRVEEGLVPDHLGEPERAGAGPGSVQHGG